jgi:tetratricopeptide (TPR) repeat protein
MGRVMLALAATSSLVLGEAGAQEAGAHQHGPGQLGRVSFSVSCTREAQRRFEQAMAVLHSFWWEEGERAFNAVLEADPTCGMAYWGQALNAWGNPFAGGPSGATLSRGAEAASRASAYPAGTPQERGFIAAASALYRNPAGSSNATRLQAYADTMARLYRDFPAVTEVAIYHALALVATAPRTDTTFARQKQAAAILNPLFLRYPDHPGLAHYVIHTTDSPQMAAHGLDAARRYARIAPAAPHAQHMPSHIFVRLGLWDETVASNWQSYKVGVAHARSLGIDGVTGEQLHALDYAVYGYLQQGQDSAARAAFATAQEARVPSQSLLIGGYNRTAMAARIPLERSDWEAAASLPEPASTPQITAALTRFARALGAARSGRLESARLEVAVLDSIATGLIREQEPYWSRVVGIKRDAAEAWIQLGLGDTAAALLLARAAADSEEVTDKHPVTPAELLPARELLGDMLLATGRYSEARKAYRATLLREPVRARSLFGAARAAELAGDRAAARAGYAEFLKLMGKADGGRQELAIAKSYINQ